MVVFHGNLRAKKDDLTIFLIEALLQLFNVSGLDLSRRVGGGRGLLRLLVVVLRYVVHIK